MARDTCQNRNNRASGVGVLCIRGRVLCIRSRGFVGLALIFSCQIFRVNDIRAPVIREICFLAEAR